MRFTPILAALALTGCVGAPTIPADPAKMTPEQLRAVASDKNANVSCVVANSPYGRGVMTYAVLDKGIVVNGTVSVDNECKITVTNTVPPAASASAAKP